MISSPSSPSTTRSISNCASRRYSAEYSVRHITARLRIATPRAARRDRCEFPATAPRQSVRYAALSTLHDLLNDRHLDRISGQGAVLAGPRAHPPVQDRRVIALPLPLLVRVARHQFFTVGGEQQFRQ